VIIDNFSTKEDIEEEVRWIENTLTKVLNTHAKPLYISAFSKRWWNDKVKEARLKYSRRRREYKSQRNSLGLEKLKAARNNYYYIVRKEKRECWKAYLEGENLDKENSLDKEKETTKEDINKCWKALKYT
jgi:hypothetical protein